MRNTRGQVFEFQSEQPGLVVVPCTFPSTMVLPCTNEGRAISTSPRLQPGASVAKAIDLP